MPKYTFILVPLCVIVCLSGCASAAYRDDRTASEVLSCVEQAIPTDTPYRRAEDDYVSASAFGDDLELVQQQVSDWAIAPSQRTDLYPDEIAVFHAAGNPKQVAAALRRHGRSLTDRLSDYYRMYAPEQLPKLGNVSVKVCGRYVLMTVLDEQQTQAAHKAFEETLQ